jgi:methionine transaminase
MNASMHTPVTLFSKLPKVGLSIFAKMSGLAQQHQALNLAQGFPDFEVSPLLIERVNQAMRAGHNQYAPMPGVMALREQIAIKTADCYGAVYDPNTEITVTAGATQAIFTAITALVREGDEVVVFNPAYDCYDPAIELAGGKTIHINLKYPHFSIDFAELKRVINRKTRMIIINSPHNPTGALISASDLKQLEKLVHNTDIIVLSDEVYEHIVFDGQSHQSVCSYPQLAERSVVVSSFGKTYHTTGWKLGYMLAPADLTAELRKVHQFNVFAVNTPMQYAMAETLKNKDEYLQLGAFYQQKRDLFVSMIAPSKFQILPAAGTYFQCLDYSAISDQRDVDFAVELVEKHGLASIPTSVFYHQDPNLRVLRFCFAKGQETLQKAAEVLNKL